MPTRVRKQQERISSTYINVGKKFTARAVVGRKEARCTRDEASEAARCAREKASRR